MLTITEVSQKYELSQDTLRYYERIGLIPPVNRNQSGIRRYTDDDCEWVHFIKCMRSAGLSIESLIEYVTLYQQGIDTVPERKKLLIEERRKLVDKIEEMNEVLGRLDFKINGYEERMEKKQGKKKV